MKHSRFENQAHALQLNGWERRRLAGEFVFISTQHAGETPALPGLIT